MTENSPLRPDPVDQSVEEGNPIQITLDDIQSVNQLSLSCPICANPVERHPAERSLSPVECTDCGTLYHRVCWQATNNKCAVLGCDCETMRAYGEGEGPILTIRRSDLRDVQPGYRNKQLKSNERARRQHPTNPQKQSFWSTLFKRILDAFS